MYIDLVKAAIVDGNNRHDLNINFTNLNLSAHDVVLHLNDLNISIVQETDIDTAQPPSYLHFISTLQTSEVILFIKNDKAVTIIPVNNTKLLLFDSHMHQTQENTLKGAYLFYAPKTDEGIVSLLQTYVNRCLFNSRGTLGSMIKYKF